MSIVAAFIQSLRLNAPVFGGRVAGAAEFYKGLRDYNTSMVLPAAYVLVLGQEAEPNETWGGLIQTVHKGIGIAVELDAQTDRRGQAPIMDLELIQGQVDRSVLNMFVPGFCMSRGVYFQAARYLDLDRARLWYQFEYGADVMITDADGVVPMPPPAPLEFVDVDIHFAPLDEHPDTAALLHIILPQEDC